MTNADRERALASMRSTQRAMFACAVAFLSIVLGMTIVWITGHREVLARLDLALLIASVLLLASATVLIVMTYRFECPQCSERFFVRARYPWWHNNLSQRCMNCGLELAGRNASALSS